MNKLKIAKEICKKKGYRIVSYPLRSDMPLNQQRRFILIKYTPGVYNKIEPLRGEGLCSFVQRMGWTREGS